jgi:hypothetical protein
MEYIIWFIIVSVIIAVSPGVRAWINGGSEGVREYKKQKKEKY